MRKASHLPSVRLLEGESPSDWEGLRRPERVAQRIADSVVLLGVAVDELPRRNADSARWLAGALDDAFTRAGSVFERLQIPPRRPLAGSGHRELLRELFHAWIEYEYARRALAWPETLDGFRNWISGWLAAATLRQDSKKK